MHDLSAVRSALATVRPDTTDSHFRVVADLAPSLDVALAKPGYDPATGQLAMHATSPETRLTVEVEVGYLPTGATLIQAIVVDDADPEPQLDDPVGFRFVDDDITVFDRQGRQVGLTAEERGDFAELVATFGGLRDLVFEQDGGMSESRLEDDPRQSIITRHERSETGAQRLAAITLEQSSVHDGRPVVIRNGISVRELDEWRNAARDQERRARLAARPVGVLRVPTSAATECPPVFVRGLMNSCQGGGDDGGDGTPPDDGVPCSEDRAWVGRPEGPVALVLQHGFLSDRCTWRVARPSLMSTFAFGLAVESSTTWSTAYWNQQAQLRSALDVHRDRKDRLVFVGHSQGGVIARLAAQQLPPSMVHGVVTLDSPNNGTLIAEPARMGAAVGILAGGMASILTAPFGLGYVGPTAHFAFGGTALATQLGSIRCGVAESMCDARPGSGILQQVNGAASPYPTVSITGRSRQSLVLARVIGDIADSRGLGGRAFSHRMRIYLATAGVIGLVGAFVPIVRPAAFWVLRIVGTVVAVDVAWRALVADSRGATVSSTPTGKRCGDRTRCH